MSILNPLRRLFIPSHAPKPGMYHYQAPPDDPRNYRMHLRLEPDGSGVLILNASTVLHLNRTAAEYAYYLVQNKPADYAAGQMAARYHVSEAQAKQDYLELSERLQTLINRPDLDPVTYLDFDRRSPFSGQISAPYRLDCALTYRMRAGSPAEAAPTERVERELTTEEWKTVLSKAWEAGIPHAVFTGGEPTLRDDLPELIAHTQAIGQVSGLITDGHRLEEEAYLHQLLQTGLDHVMLVLHPEDEGFWQMLTHAMVEDLFVAVHLTLTPADAGEAIPRLERLKEMGVKQVSLSASDASLAAALAAARDRAAILDLDLIWNLPVPYSSQHPVALETESVAQEEGAGRAWLYVEPDGDVLRTQGDPRVIGNFLTDPWEKIWKK